MSVQRRQNFLLIDLSAADDDKSSLFDGYKRLGESFSLMWCSLVICELNALPPNLVCRIATKPWAGLQRIIQVSLLPLPPLGLRKWTVGGIFEWRKWTLSILTWPFQNCPFWLWTIPNSHSASEFVFRAKLKFIDKPD